MTEPLTVCLHGRAVGSLAQDAAGKLTFTYATAWLADPANPPLSLALPLKPEPFDDAGTKPFFANLLPDAEVRRHLAESLGLSEGNDFALLRAVGGDCAGAVSVLPPGVELPQGGSFRPVAKARLAKLLDELPQRPLLADGDDDEIRLSLAGAQYKLPVFVASDDNVFLPVGSYASSHILKPPNKTFPDLVANEFFCMRLAEAAGLPVPKVSVRQVGFPVYQIERYDRAPASPSPLRLHQEDFCQALGLGPDQKYEAEGGPTLARCFQLVDEVSVQPAVDRLALLRWTIFNLLVGNADAHAKNLSLLLEGGPKLAPFYDLVSTAIVPRLSKKQAMRIGGENEWIKVHAKRWDRFAEETNMTPRLVRDEVAKLAEALPGHAASVMSAAAEALPSETYAAIGAEVARRSISVLTNLAKGA